MDPNTIATVLAAIQAARSLIVNGVAWAELAKSEGKISQEQLDAIKEAGRISDSNYNSAIARAKASG